MVHCTFIRLAALSGKLALVTGGTRGLGHGIAKALAANGSDVIVTGSKQLEEKDTKRLADSIRLEGDNQITYLGADITNGAGIKQLIANLKPITPNGVDILINNAGFQHVCPIDDYPEEVWDQMVSIHLAASFHLSKHVIPGMRQKGWGRIINMGSIHAVIATAGKSVYTSLKHALVGLTKGTALDTAEAGITCNLIGPGYILTDLVHKQIAELVEQTGKSSDEVLAEIASRHPTHKLATVEQIGGTVSFLCSPAADQITGNVMLVDGGYCAR